VNKRIDAETVEIKIRIRTVVVLDIISTSKLVPFSFLTNNHHYYNWSENQITTNLEFRQHALLVVMAEYIAKGDNRFCSLDKIISLVDK
jgi:hypothetical protein